MIMQLFLDDNFYTEVPAEQLTDADLIVASEADKLKKITNPKALVKRRGHRIALMNPAYKYAGVGAAPHA